jgi:hypothetical protein
MLQNRFFKKQINNYTSISYFHTTSYLKASNLDELLEYFKTLIAGDQTTQDFEIFARDQLSIKVEEIIMAFYVDYFVEEHLKDSLIILNNSELNSYISLQKLDKLARELIVYAIESGDLLPFDKDELLKTLKCIPEHILSSVVEIGRTALENDFAHLKEVAGVNSDEEIDNDIKCV